MKRTYSVYLYICVIVFLCFCVNAPKANAASVIKNGIYNIITALDSNKALDVWGAGVDNGTNIQIYDLHDNWNQQFEITRVTDVPGIWYKIIDQNSGKALDVEGGVSGPEVNVQLYDYNGTDAQLWQLEYAASGYYYVKNKLGFYLDVKGADTSNETNVQVYYKNWSAVQKFKFKPTETHELITENTYIIKSALDSGMAVDVTGGWSDNGTNIQLWEANNTGAQKFVISLVKDGYYKIANESSKKVLDVAGGLKRSGVNVQLYEYNGTDAQLWRFYENGGYYYIKNKLGYYLDVYGVLAYSGANIRVYGRTGKKLSCST